MALDWSQLRYPHTGAVRAALAEQFSPTTVNKQLSALRGVLKECWRLGTVGAEDYYRAVDVQGVQGQTLPRGRALSSGELRGLLGACAQDETAAGIRDAALLAVLYAGGLRRAELVALDRDDYDSETGALTIRSGKGRKARISYIGDGAAEILADWLAFRGSAPGPLFSAINKSGVIHTGRLSPQAVLACADKRAAQAGIAHISPHDLRRSFVSDLLDAGADISAVQQLVQGACKRDAV